MDLPPKTLPFSLPDKGEYWYEFDEELNGFHIKIPHGELFYSECFFDEKVSDRSIEYFLENNTNDGQTADWGEFDKDKLSQVKFKNIDWQHDKIVLYGKDVFLPRYSAWYADSDKPYTYSGLTLQPKQWNKGLLFIRDKVNEVAGVHFNSVLMNWYRDGEDHISWHTDAEPELGINPVIASVTFGEPRDFILRKNDTLEKVTIPLKHGTVLIMKGEVQHFWRHSVPKRKRIKKARFNLTFRVVNH